ncbi:helix-turn-helix domain-containing protein [Phocoenobacter skyensis]|uniref:Helix-turn-helix transcriptional regulator n=1 Tax=Phocoenobacter skyensis TaxID=97481 RepID=A0A1H7YZ25_9PAST|nr:helix-turn-helix transcriptional regulator [Pasteurella skyensis]MDP8080112.1 helix-turn-helix transcriptional regulator [Pasteurella skyensis]MDP8086120.1 helix-turn-helix transcriptional regulator [Pasteurella skyensis]MDP8171465.1 helix-turn-helix transcriptional regulator [Pasteurella skyensis]MDP8175705.1 helix-turn-helix transcriptional regulator [Pasteurella skyensis]MDP8185796.1 helix-turn-helix transcriptional regulator [Pasteurella skyensis]
MRFDFYTPSEISQILGQRLKQHRLHQNLTQAQLAEQIGVGVSTVVRIESGKGGTLENVLHIAIGLGLINEFADLFDYKPKTVEEVIQKYAPRQRASGK